MKGEQEPEGSGHHREAHTVTWAHRGLQRLKRRPENLPGTDLCTLHICSSLKLGLPMRLLIVGTDAVSDSFTDFWDPTHTESPCPSLIQREVLSLTIS